MRSIAFAIQLEGEAVELGGGRYWVETRALRDGSAPPQQQELGVGNALCRRDLELWDDGSLVETGELSFGDVDAITFRARGALASSPEPGRRHGTAVLEVTGGRGRLVGARGYVTSNFLLSENGDLTDHHLGLLFLERPV